MAEDLTVQLLSMQSADTRQLAQITVLRTANEMQAAAADIVDDATKSTPAPASPGTGLVIDKHA